MNVTDKDNKGVFETRNSILVPKKLITPVLFLIFNRPDTTQRVFNEIRKVEPVELFVAADGPRDGNDSDVEKCLMAREIVKQVDWDCEVKKLFRDKNLGCKMAPISAIDWFFENVEEGIILEDDCLPSQSFFYFCQELLDYYRNDTRVMHISGDNFQFGIQRGDASYYFSKINNGWGWATWRRAWKYFDVNMKSFEEFKNENRIHDIFRAKKEQEYWMRLFQKIYDGKINSCWDYQWVYSTIIAHGISINPNLNLIQNIGFGPDSTHTNDAGARLKHNFAKEITFPLLHPGFILVDEDADEFLFKNIYSKNVYVRIKDKIRRFCHGMLAKTKR